jgi:hypothetical protein
MRTAGTSSELPVGLPTTDPIDFEVRSGRRIFVRPIFLGISMKLQVGTSKPLHPLFLICSDTFANPEARPRNLRFGVRHIA